MKYKQSTPEQRRQLCLMIESDMMHVGSQSIGCAGDVTVRCYSSPVARIAHYHCSAVFQNLSLHAALTYYAELKKDWTVHNFETTNLPPEEMHGEFVEITFQLREDQLSIEGFLELAENTH